ncbi:MAG: hypothetical protein OXC62_10295 [Aestuariivita sp.]|nr:hypothetical protein [Aestuariivita sp.]
MSRPNLAYGQGAVPRLTSQAVDGFSLSSDTRPWDLRGLRR